MLYAFEHIPELRGATIERLLNEVSEQRRAYALRFTHEHGQYCCLRSWEMVYELLTAGGYIADSLPLKALVYATNEYGKPYLEGIRGYISLSHTKNAIAVAVSRREVGIDIESIVSLNRLGTPSDEQSLLTRTMSDEEQKEIREAVNPSVKFTELWTRKEAVFKYLGIGINMEQMPNLLEDKLLRDERLRLITTTKSDFVCSVCYEKVPHGM